jgi:hypothetical protein
MWHSDVVRYIPKISITDKCIEWENPNLPYEQVVVDEKQKISWESLGIDPSLSYDFLKKYRNELGPNITFHHNSGDLLLDILKHNENQKQYVFGNPSLPFDKLTELGGYIN